MHVLVNLMIRFELFYTLFFMVIMLVLLSAHKRYQIHRVVGPMLLCKAEKAVSAHFTSEQILPFGFARHYSVEKQTTVACYFSRKQLVLFAAARL